VGWGGAGARWPLAQPSTYQAQGLHGEGAGGQFGDQATRRRQRWGGRPEPRHRQPQQHGHAQGLLQQGGGGLLADRVQHVGHVLHAATGAQQILPFQASAPGPGRLLGQRSVPVEHEGVEDGGQGG
jgi:hypothetical protein